MFESWFGRRVKSYCNWIKFDPHGLPTALGLILMGLNIIEERVWKAIEKFLTYVDRFIEWWSHP